MHQPTPPVHVASRDNRRWLIPGRSTIQHFGKRSFILLAGLGLFGLRAFCLDVAIKPANGQPQLVINGEPQVPLSFFGWALEQPQRTAVDADWREVNLRFVADENTDGFVILFNRIDEGIPGSLWIDDLHVSTGNELDKPAVGADLMEQCGSQLPAGWALTFGRNAGVDASWEYDGKVFASGTRSLRIDVRKNPPPGWLGLEVKGLHLNKGELFAVAFRTKSTMPGYAEVVPLANGQRTSGTRDPEESLYARQVRLAAAHGIHMHQFSFPVPFIGSSDEAAMYEALDRAMAVTLREDPQAMITIRFGVDDGGKWRRAFPDECETLSDGLRLFPSPSSRKWLEAMSPALDKAVRHLEEKWGSHAAVYMLSGKNTGEWFYPVWEPGQLPGFAPATRDGFRRWLEKKYRTPEALAQSWGRPVAGFDQIELPDASARRSASLGEFFDPRKDADRIDFFDFYNDAMADALSLLAATVKNACGGKKPVMAFYGYLHALAGSRAGLAHSGHLKWSRLLRDPNIDMFCGPNAYINREPGGPGAFHGPVDALAPYGKFWFCEDDTLTLAAPMTAFPKGRCRTDQEVADVQRRNFAQDFPRGFGCWYMDLQNAGWLLNDALWQGIGTMNRFWKEHLKNPQPYRPEIVFLADEVSPLYLRSDTLLHRLLLDDMPRPVSQVGAPVGWSLLGAFLDGKVPPAKLYIFPNAFVLTADQRAKARDILRAQKATAVWFYAPGLIDPTTRTAGTETMRELTGMDILPMGRSEGKRLRLTSGLPCTWEDPSAKGKILQRWQVKPSPGVEPLALYEGTPGLIGAASVRIDGWRSVYIASPTAPAELLRRLARDAGVWLYDEAGDTILGGGSFLGIHAASDGSKSLRLPEKVTPRDIMTGATLPASDRLEFPMKRGETRMFWLEKP